MAKNVVQRIDKNLARRLAEARREIGLSTRAVAKRLPDDNRVSHTTIAGYENGTSVPTVSVLGSLATVYERPVNWFLGSREIFTGFTYRNLQSRVPLTEQRKYAAQAGKWAEAYFALETHLKTDRQHRSEDVDGRLPGQLAQQIRQQHLDLDDAQPVQNTVAVLESFSTWAIELAANFRVDGAAAKLSGRPVVVLNPNIANERARFNLCHELAFALYAQGNDVSPLEVEHNAQVFASSLIIPDSQIRDAFSGRSFLKLIQFKERFGISLSAMIHRAEELEVINTTASRWLRSEMTKRGWRRNEPGYVWRDRAIAFETMLESAIETKQITWEDAERITSIPGHELQARLISASTIGSSQPSEDEEPKTLKLFT